MSHRQVPEPTVSPYGRSGRERQPPGSLGIFRRRQLERSASKSDLSHATQRAPPGEVRGALDHQPSFQALHTTPKASAIYHVRIVRSSRQRS